MKKIKLLVLSLCAVSVLSFAGCKPSTGGENNPADNPAGGEETPATPAKSTSVDLRNKNASGEVYKGRFAGRAADGELLEQKLVEVGSNPDNLSDADLENMITLYDSAAGMKVVFTAPESEKNSNLDYFEMVYIDGTGKWSTSLALENSIRNAEGKVKPQFEFDYPLVIAEKESKFVFQFSFADGVDGQFYKTVTPKHGKGRVDDLPEDFYDYAKYSEFKDGVMTLKNVVPPEATSVKKTVYVQCNKTKDNIWATGGKQIRGITKDIENGHISDFFLGDIETVGHDGKALNLSDTPYGAVIMKYEYTMKNFDGLTFSTPGLQTVVSDVDFFKTPVAERSVSKTVVDGNKVTFSGDGYFDGLYEGDIKVAYNKESFVPAVFVKGLDVYVLAVENGKYTKKEKVTISDFLDAGGSFANVDGSTVYVKLKTDTSEANLDKSDVTEITVEELADPVGEITVKFEEVVSEVEIAENYAWNEDGTRDTTVISNYQAECKITSVYDGNLPKKGDIIHFTWKGKSDTDVSKITVIAVENTAAVGWWKEMSDDYYLENIKADTPFEKSLDIVLSKRDCVEEISLVFSIGKEDISAPVKIVKVSE